METKEEILKLIDDAQSKIIAMINIINKEGEENEDDK